MCTLWPYPTVVTVVAGRSSFAVSSYERVEGGADGIAEGAREDGIQVEF